MKINNPHFVSLVVGVVALSVLPISSTLAQETGGRVLEEILVTAAYREQGLQDVPVSISAVAG